MTPRTQRIINSIDQWTVPPAAQGQIVECAYGIDWESETMVCRSTDRSDGSVTYAIAPAPDRWEPWQTEPKGRWTAIR